MSNRFNNKCVATLTVKEVHSNALEIFECTFKKDNQLKVINREPLKVEFEDIKDFSTPNTPHTFFLDSISTKDDIFSGLSLSFLMGSNCKRVSLKMGELDTATFLPTFTIEVNPPIYNKNRKSKLFTELKNAGLTSRLINHFSECEISGDDFTIPVCQRQ